MSNFYAEDKDEKKEGTKSNDAAGVPSNTPPYGNNNPYNPDINYGYGRYVQELKNDRGFSYGLEDERKTVPHRGSYDMSHYEPKRKSGFSVVLIALFMIFMMALVLVGGMFVMRYINLSNSESDGVVAEDPSIPEVDPNKPTLEISDRPTTSVFETPTDGLTIPQISELVGPSVVGIVSESAYATSTGSGMFMTTDGYIITNAHVVDGDETYVITADEKQYAAQVVGKDAKTDLCVLKVEGEDFPAVEFGKSEELVRGEIAVVIGNPISLELFGSLSAGVISAVDRTISLDDRTMNLIQTDASVNPGNSGGPLINGFGQVIGIITIKLDAADYEGLGFAIPIHEAKPIIDSLINFGYVPGRPVIGITAEDVDEFYASLYDTPMGVYIHTVDEASDAFAKGLKTGDIIIEINGKEIKTMVELNEEKDKFKSGESLTMTIYREGTVFEVDIVLMEAQRDE